MYYRRTDGRVPLRQQDSAFTIVARNQRFQQVLNTYNLIHKVLL